jgi:transcriptional regulator of acetoin/glycerol metabolism
MAGNGRASDRRPGKTLTGEPARNAGPPIPGVVIVWSGESPMTQALRLPSLGLILGRELLGPRTTDDRISRQHARVRWNGHAFAITDLGSRNGTYVGGSLVSESEVTVTPPCVLRTGRTVSVLVGDVRPYEGGEVAVTPDGVVGPRRALAHDAMRRIAAGPEAHDSVLVVGEPGAGVDAAVTIFHHAAARDAAGGDRPLVELEATRLAEGGAARWWQGAGGAPPEVVRAHQGTLVIHDLTALDAAGQSAVSQILARGELTTPQGTWPVEARLIAVCEPDDLDALRSAVTGNAFRDDLWRRLQHRVELPPLRSCCEEIPHWVVSRIREVMPDLAVHSTMIEACLLRPWPGNVDELRHEVTRAAHLARDAGKRTVRGEHLDADAGMMVALASGATTLSPGLLETARLRKSRVKNPLELGGVRAALDQHGGDLARAAVTLGVHRNRLRRFIAEHPELAPLVSGDDAHRTAVVTEDE